MAHLYTAKMLNGRFRFRVDNRPNKTKKDAFLNLSGLVWTGPTFIFLIEESNRKGFQNECQTKNFFF